MSTTVRPKPRIFLIAASLPRALGESLALGLPLFLLLLYFRDALRNNGFVQGIMFLVPAVAFWFAIRFRLPAGRWSRQLVAEVLASAALAIPFSLACSGLVWAMGGTEVFSQGLFGVSYLWLYLLLASPMFLAFRVGVHVWSYWDRLQRRRLLWSITDTLLRVVILVVALVAVIFGLIVILPQGGNGFDIVMFTILPFAGVMVVMGLLALVGVLPPAMLIGYLAARRTTGRLESLTKATSALRRGEYDARLQVQGEDEIAQLQADFNAMAAELDSAVNDLKAERDKVAGLLQARRELVAAVSHELRTPLATIRGYLEPLQARTDLDDPTRHELDIMEGELSRLQRLIEDLFTLSRAEAGGLTLEMGPTDAAAVIRRQAEALAPIAWEGSKVEVVAEISEGLPMARADGGRLAQVLANLLRNAVRHTPPGGIVAVMAGAEDNAIRIEVRDTGEGIPPEELPEIWERFYRGASARSEDQRGAGLGLALVKELVEAMGGSVGVESRIGEGSCFTVRLLRA